MNIKEVKYILKELKIRPKQRLGQNFLIDKNIANKIIFESDLSKDDIILEIGPGLGALTKLLVKNAKKVYAIEIDSQFCKYLSEKFSKYGNIEIINANILTTDLPYHNKVVSNIPYSITGPLLEKVFFTKNPPHGILTVEKSIADRIFFNGNYKKFSRITVSLNSFMKPIAKFKISRNSFYPVPNIDLALIKIKPIKDIAPFLLDHDKKKYFLRFLADIMPYKNKDLVNALKMYLKKNNIFNVKNPEILQILRKKDFDNKKLFSFKIEDFVELSELFFNLTIIEKDRD
ncbi:MAG: 16S rRNA (adenine(1518)-N(6)/adenine(1519)-N(6))-dimethyltransferase RsmA [Promethearchaeota archaeon]